MYEQPGGYRSMGRETDAGVDSPGGLVLVLQRVRKLLTGYLPGMRAEPARFRPLLTRAVPAAGVEAERRFALGWLSWLEGDPSQAAAEFNAVSPLLDSGAGGGLPGLPPLDPGELAGRTAYWLARVRLLAGQNDALAPYEAAMRRAGGPQPTAWYVDLLFRAGRVDRVEAVWKTVRTNSRVLACDEAPLLEARLHLRRGEPGAAERLLRDAAPRSGVAWTERWLWLAWALVELRRPEPARAALAQAHQGPYPHRPLAAWSAAVEARLGGPPAPLTADAAGWREFVQGQQARRAGHADEARRLYRAALDVPAVAPFAGYGLVCLGDGDPSAVLAASPGTFLAARARWRQQVERFRLRQVEAAAFLDAARANRGATDHFGRLATLLNQSTATDEMARRVEREPAGPARRNALLAVLESSADLSPPVTTMLVEAASEAGDDWRRTVARSLLGLACDRSNRQLLDSAIAAYPGEPLAAVAAALLAPAAAAPVDHPLVRLRNVAIHLYRGEADDETRQWLRGVADGSRPLAQTLLLADAARREDLAAVRTLLEGRAGSGSGERPTPPRFLVRQLDALVLRYPGFAGWQAALPGWLDAWPRVPVDSLLAVYARRAVLLSAAGTPASAPWLLHQAVRAVLRRDLDTALVCLYHAGTKAPDATVSLAPLLPRLQRLVDADRLAHALGLSVDPALWADVIDQLVAAPAGRPLLDAAWRGDAIAARARLAELADAADLPAQPAHHLALIETRLAETAEDTDPATACDGWRRAWRHWFRWLAGDDPRAGSVRPLLLAHLLDRHRHRLNDYLARGETAAAAGLWSLVGSLPASAAGTPFAAEVVDRVAGFHDELATEYLLTTREAMRLGAIPEGWRADYPRGLAMLDRLLALDADNERLLTAFVETCNDWALDLYHCQRWAELQALVDRAAPAADRLRRLIDGRTGELLARNALSELCKVRGFVEPNAGRKAEHYREALRLNPANRNARELLAELESPGGDDAG